MKLTRRGGVACKKPATVLQNVQDLESAEDPVGVAGF